MVLALVLAEIVARLASSTFSPQRWTELEQFSSVREGSAFVIDPEMGFRPVLGYREHEGREVYSRYGTIKNEYSLRKPPGIRRVLFLGDSVTARGAIVKALREVYGDQGIEYWNAGVESFNTRQEVEFYRRFNFQIDPDQVVLTLHINDFQVTPVAFVDEDGLLKVYSPNRSLTGWQRFLFHHSALYRHFQALLLTQNEPFVEAATEVRNALRQLQGLLGDEVRLDVLIFPVLKQGEEWTQREQRAGQAALEICQDLQLQCFDLTPLMFQRLEAGKAVRQRPKDIWHPNEDFAREIAAYLHNEGLLAPF